MYQPPYTPPNYNSYNYNPYQNSYNTLGQMQDTQNRINYLQNQQAQMQAMQNQQYQQPQPQQQPNNNIIMVGGIDEVKAHAVDWSGNVTYFVDKGNNKIYTKELGLNGIPITKSYSLETDGTDAKKEEQKEEPKKEYVLKSDFDNLLARYNNLEAQLLNIINNPTPQATAKTTVKEE